MPSIRETSPNNIAARIKNDTDSFNVEVIEPTLGTASQFKWLLRLLYCEPSLILYTRNHVLFQTPPVKYSVAKPSMRIFRGKYPLHCVSVRAVKDADGTKYELVCSIKDDQPLEALIQSIQVVEAFLYYYTV